MSMLVTYEQACDQLRLDSDVDQADVTLKIEAASEAVLNYLKDTDSYFDYRRRCYRRQCSGCRQKMRALPCRRALCRSRRSGQLGLGRWKTSAGRHRPPDPFARSNDGVMLAICIASGPSLTQEDVDYCRGKGKVYAVNNVYTLAPWADVLYACDQAWWDEHNGVPDFAGQKWTIDRIAAKNYGLNRIGIANGSHWSNIPGEIALGMNSGFQALKDALK